MATLPQAGLFVLALLGTVAAAPPEPPAAAREKPRPPAPGPAVPPAAPVVEVMQARLDADLEAMRSFRPGYAFWQHIFTIPDGSIAFGRGDDGRLLVVFPARGDWTRSGEWKVSGLAGSVAGRRFSARLSDRREEMAALLEEDLGPVLHNPTRGTFVRPNADRYGRFLDDWGRIYERFGVPSDVGLAQVLIESGLSGTVRSQAQAIGFCQWLPSNWRRLQRLAPYVIEAHNQTTQAPFCAAYLSVLATKYGTFIPALSEHHSGGTNVGRTLINGGRLGGRSVREQYFLGAELTRDLRLHAPRSYRDIYGTYGPRSYRYAEMVFGNTVNVRQIKETVPQQRIHAMRTPRALALSEITRRTGLSAEAVKLYNPALVRQVPARAHLYLPSYVKDFGTRVSFWHDPPDRQYLTVLNEFVQIEATLDEWDSPGFVPVLESFRNRFRATGTEEGTVMATVLGFVIEDIQTSRRGAILREFRASQHIRALFDQAVDAVRSVRDLLVRESP